MLIITVITFEIEAYGQTFIIRFNQQGLNEYGVSVKIKGTNIIFYEYCTERLRKNYHSGAAATLILEQALNKYPKFKKSLS